MEINKPNLDELLLRFCESEEIDHISVETLLHPDHKIYIAKVFTKLYDLNADSPFQETNYPNYLEEYLEKELENYIVRVDYTSDHQLLIILIG